MPLQVRYCDSQDLPSCSSIHWSALASNPLWQILFPNGGTPELQQWMTYHMQCEFNDPDIHFNKVVHSSAADRKIIGIARWTVEDLSILTEREGVGESEEGKRNTGTSNWSFSPPDVPEEDTNEAFFNQWIPELIESRHKNITGNQTIVLDDLCVLPDYQRQGAGTLLLESLVDFADERGLPCYLQSTPFAYNMYTHHGFRNVDMIEIDLEKWKEGCEMYQVAIMYRDARGNSGHGQGVK
ncbi:MAG: hypothetical protein Q9170_006163 [Blastenia crenularia]